MRRIVNRLITAMSDKNMTLALAESMTCGLAAHQLSVVKGTSDVLKGSIVCYHEDVKTQLLGISSKLIEKHSAESKEVTEKMCTQLKKLIKADIYVAITGLASDGGSESKSKPVGTVFYSIIINNKKYNLRKQFKGSPLMVRKAACKFLYVNLIAMIKKIKN